MNWTFLFCDMFKKLRNGEKRGSTSEKSILTSKKSCRTEIELSAGFDFDSVTDFKNSTRWLVRQVKRPEGLDIHLKLCLQTIVSSLHPFNPSGLFSREHYFLVLV